MAKKKKAIKKKHTKKRAAKKKVTNSKRQKPKRGMMLVHRTALAGAAKITAPETTRYAIAGVRVESQKDGGYSVEATDGKRIIRIEGKSDAVSDFPAIKNAGGFKAVTIPTDAAMAAIKATTKRSAMPILENVAVMEGDGKAVRLVATDLSITADNQAQPLEEKWPPCDDIWPTGKPVAVVGVTAELLEGLLQGICKAAVGWDKHTTVKLEIFGPKKPIRLSAHNDRHNVTALLMPFALD